jgi:hypothetical protein
VTVSGVDSVECAFTHMNAAFRQNLSVVVPVRRKQQRHRTRHARLTRRCRDSSAVLPDDGDTHPGRERPPRIEARDRVRGWQRGSLTPPDTSATAADSRAHFDAGGTERRPVSAAKSHTAKNIAGSTHLATTLTRPRAWQRAARQGGGTLLPRLCSPSCARHSYASCVY